MPVIVAAPSADVQCISQTFFGGIVPRKKNLQFLAKRLLNRVALLVRVYECRYTTL